MNINESTLREYVNNVVNKLIEDIQTPERAKQQQKRIKSAERSAIFGSWRNRADSIGRLRQLQRIDAREKADTKTTWGVSEPHHIRGHDESTPRRSRKRKISEGAVEKIKEKIKGMLGKTPKKPKAKKEQKPGLMSSIRTAAGDIVGHSGIFDIL